MSVGLFHAACITDDNRGIVLTYGHGSSGQLGHGNTQDYVHPTEVVAPSSKFVLRISDPPAPY